MGISPNKKGVAKRGGRKKGTPNRTTAAVKEAILSVYDGLGGDEAMLNWARRNRTEFYRMYAKLLPTEIKNADGEPLRIEIVEQVVPSREDGAQDDPVVPATAPVPTLPG